MSTDAIDDEIKEMYHLVHQKKRIKDHLVSLEHDIKVTEREEHKLRAILEKEYEDILRLEEMNLRSAFNHFLGKKEHLLEIERQEYLHALLNHETVEHRLKELVYELEVLQKQLINLAHVDEAYQKLLTKKELQLRQKGKYKAELMILDQKILNREEQLKELNEAIVHGNILENSLSLLQEELGKIKQWGIPSDGFHGKGRYSSIKKKHYVRSTKDLLLRIDKELHSFQSELDDLYRQFDFTFGQQYNQVSEFLDVFYNNLITDWIVPRSLKSAKHSVGNLLAKLQRIKITLEHEQTSMKEETKLYLADRERLIVET